MRLLHVTHMKNRYPIEWLGLLPLTQTPKSGERLYAVETHKLAWACNRIMKRHKCTFDQLIVIDCGMAYPTEWRHYNRGIWYKNHTHRYRKAMSAREFLKKNPGLTLHNQEIWDRLL